MHAISLVALFAVLPLGSTFAQSWDQRVARRWPGDAILKVSEPEFEAFLHGHTLRGDDKENAMAAFLTAQHRAYGHPPTPEPWFVNPGRATVLPPSPLDGSVAEGPEPNGDPNAGGTPTPLGCGDQGNGAIGRANPELDEDWWELTVATPSDVTIFTSAGSRVGTRPMTDTVLELYDSASTLIASDDDSGVGFHSLLTRTLQPGTYYVAVRQFSAATPTGSYGVDVVCEPATSGRSAVQEGAEPNQRGGGTPTVMPFPADGLGSVDPAGDSDWWTFTITAPTRIRAVTRGDGGNAQIADTTLALHDDAGTRLAFDDDGGPGLFSMIEFDLPAAGTYHLDVRGFTDRTGRYVLMNDVPPTEIVATYATDASGCAGSNGTPTITPRAGEVPRIGSTFEVDVTAMPADAPAIGNLGFTQQIGNLVLPFDLAPFGAAGCLVATDVGETYPLVADPAGSASWSISIPVLPQLADLPFYQQVVVLDPPATPLGVTTSNLGTGRMGNAVR